MSVPKQIISKCKQVKIYISFSKSNLKTSSMKNLPINNHPVEHVTQFKFLGYYLEEKLSWNIHISIISTKIAKHIGLLCKLRKVLNNFTLRNLYFSLIHSYINTGLIIWGSTAKVYLNQIIKLQKKIIRIIDHSSPREHTTPTFKKHHILPILNNTY